MKEPSSSSCVIAIHAIPGARQSSVAGLHGDSIRVKIQAPPVDGKANQALLDFLAEKLGIKARDISLIRGETSREKVVSVNGFSRNEVLKRLGLGG